MPQAVRANVRATVNVLRNGSSLLEQQLLHGGLRIVGADYDLSSRFVDFFEGETA